MSDNWKEKLQEIGKGLSEASQNKITNKTNAVQWIRDELIPAFKELVAELPKVSGIESVSWNADGIAPNNTLDFKFQETSLRYSIKLCVSSKDVMGEVSFTANITNTITEKQIPSIIKRGKQEIIDDFLSAFETWEII